MIQHLTTAHKIIIIIIIIYIPGIIDPRGWKLEAKNKHHWRLEVQVFVREAEGAHNVVMQRLTRRVTVKDHESQTQSLESFISTKLQLYANNTALLQSNFHVHPHIKLIPTF